MILKISCNLWGKNIPTNSKELAELVVTLAEENGMLPPRTENPEHNDWLQIPKYMNEWERESEDS